MVYGGAPTLLSGIFLSCSEELRSGESIWHAFGLEAGEHDLRLVVRGESYGESRGQRITVQDLIVFR